MKRTALWIVGAGVAGLALMLALRAQEQQGQTTQAPDPAQPEKIAFTFTDEEQMKEFAKVWQQRQAVITRMAVLQAYWNQEQPNLQESNTQLLSKYNLDVNKNYTLDAVRKVLVEQEATTPPPTELNQQTPATP